MPGDFLGGSLAPIGLSVSFLATPIDAVLDHLVAWRSGLGQQFERSDQGAFPGCASALDPLEAPWTTELLLDCGTWTAYLNNDIDGGDPTAAAPYLSKALGVRCAVAMHAPRYSPGHASTQLWLLGPEGEPPLMYERTLAADAVDGRWSWDESGTVQPFEHLSRYTARRVRDRFDRPLLIEYLAALGIRADDAGFYGAGISLHQHVTWPTRRETSQQVRRRFGW